MSRNDDWIDTDAEHDYYDRTRDDAAYERATLRRELAADPHTDWGYQPEDIQARLQAMAALRKVRNQ